MDVQLKPSTRDSSKLFRGGLIVLAMMLALSAPSSAHANGDAKQAVTLFTAVTMKGDTENFPEKLKPYRKSLLKIAKAFRLAGSKEESLETGKEVKVTLPEKLGVAKITWNGKTATIKVEKDGKIVATLKVSKFPTYLVDDSLKVKGDQVVLIVDKKKAKP